MSPKFSMFSLASSSLLMVSAGGFFSGAASLICSRSLIIEWELFSLSSALVSMSLVIDWMSLFFFGSVCLISGSIMKYSEYYMEGDLNFMRFFYILSMFVLSMWVLIISPNMVSLLLGWDGLGLTSYALVIYYQNELSCNAGMLTVLSNRVGDVALLLSIALMAGEGGWDFYKSAYGLTPGVTGLVILAGFTKSAQMPFSAWLPAAMAAPTPVSALVHSSTLVAAGVYLLIRFSDAIEKSGAGGVVFSVASLTMFMAALGAVLEVDMKKVVALSTLSQLGLMIMVLGAGMKELAFFHLITHAMFKASLFMCVGFVIHGGEGDQDSRRVSTLSLSSPVLGVVLGATNLALCGFPFLAGFYSKEAVLECVHFGISSISFIGLAMASVGLTVAYSLRLMHAVAGGVSSAGSASGLSDFNFTVAKAVCVLFLASLFSGFLMHWVTLPLEAPWVVSGLQKHAVLLAGVVGGFGAHASLQVKSVSAGGGAKLFEIAASCVWFLGQLSTKIFAGGLLASGLSCVKVVDTGWFEYFGGQGGRTLALSSGSVLQKGQGGLMVQGFMITVFLSVVFVLLAG